MSNPTPSSSQDVSLEGIGRMSPAEATSARDAIKAHHYEMITPAAARRILRNRAKAPDLGINYAAGVDAVTRAALTRESAAS